MDLQPDHRLYSFIPAGIIKFNRPGQAVVIGQRQKLNAIGVEFKGRNVLLVDDRAAVAERSQAH